ncbi:hypothetical protein ERO13_D10G232416v2 [Gossypium hirsutum]|nr:hypothetical protein ERO13_D10G232416v2 [Gossypium hirsutum]
MCSMEKSICSICSSLFILSSICSTPTDINFACNFCKLFLQWPLLAYSSNLSCRPPILNEFTIHGIWTHNAN